MKYFLSLGSNINAEENLEFGYKKLKKILSNIKSSSIHQTKAEGFEGDDFLNSIVCGNSDMDFTNLNKELKLIEDDAGRNRNTPKYFSIFIRNKVIHKKCFFCIEFVVIPMTE